MNESKLPKDWRMVKLGKYVISVKGKKPKKISKEKTKEYFLPYVNIKAFEKGIVDEYTDGIGCVICEEGDFLMVWDGSRSGYVGKGIKGALGSTLVKLNFPDINNNYAYYFLQSKYTEINTRAKGVGIPHVDPNLLWNYELLIPSLKTQQTIVSKIEELFSELGKGIEDLKTAQQQLKVYRQSVLKYAFEGRFTNNNVSCLPESWGIKNFGEIVNNYDGKRKPLSKNIRDQRQGKYRYFGATEVVDYIDDYIFDGRYLLIGEDGANLVSKSKSLAFIVEGKFWVNNHAHIVQPKEFINIDYLFYYFNSLNLSEHITGTAQPKLNQANMNKIPIPIPSIEEQNKIVQVLESRLSITDKIEENIQESLLKAEIIRQSILKKAFNGELVNEIVEEKIFKPKNNYFFQMQLIGKIAVISKKNNIEHGEMTIAKYAYLIDKIYSIPSGFTFNRWHLGPYPPAIKKVVNNRQYFQRNNQHIEVVNEHVLFKSENEYTSVIDNAVAELVNVFSKYKIPSERAHKTELLATVCKVIEDIKVTDLKEIRSSMKEWKIDLKTSSFKNKAEKFNENETKTCIDFIVSKGWEKKLIKGE